MPVTPRTDLAARGGRLRLLLGAAVLLAGCASGGDARTVHVSSDAYGCGAVEGLGCGLAIAPVLHRIDALEGVERSSVSWDGHTFRIELLPGADRERVASAAAAVLEGEACCVVAPRGQTAERPDQWFDEDGTRALSRHEAGVIASDFAAEIAAEVAVEPGVAEQLRGLLREEFERAFEAAHAAGGGVDRLWEQLPAARSRFEARLPELLPPADCARVLAIVDRELGAR